MTAVTCPHCGFEARLESRFCASCGTALFDAVAAKVVGERRYLTTMFCDLAGSTDLSERLDPEDFAEVVLAYQEMGRAIVVGFGGLVAHYAGDGLLSFFGYPLAHEDDADRAVLAGLSILESMAGLNARARHVGAVKLEARIGIHTGPTVIGTMGSSDRSDISLFGSTPNIAARLEAFALPGTVVVSDAVSRVLRGRYRLSNLGRPELKGVSQPFPVCRVDGLGTADTAAAQSKAHLIVGRDRETSALLTAFERAVAEGKQTVLVSGEPGVGKSALVRALSSRLADREHQWVEIRCSEIASASPLRPVIEGVRHQLEITDDETLVSQLAKLERGTDSLGSAASGHLPFLADALGIPLNDSPEFAGLSGEMRRVRTLDALVEWALALSRQSPLVLVIEDLHWADPSTLELLSRLVGRRSDLPVLCLCTSRVGVPDDWGRVGMTLLALGRLGLAESRALAVSLNAPYDLPDDTLVQLADRGDGVPLFIEELVRGAAEAVGGRSDALKELPDTLQSVLAARLDRLGEARVLAQAASVIGREFSLALLSTVVDAPVESLTPPLLQLVDAGIVSQQIGRGLNEYAFRHALIQDAAYESMLRRRRRELHSATASALTDRFPIVADTAPELVAHHHEEAGAQFEAARWYGIAGRRAAERAALREAILHYESGIELLKHPAGRRESDELLLSLLILCGNAHMGTSGPGAEETLPLWESAIALARRLEDNQELTSAINGAAVYWADRGDLDQAIELAMRILKIGEATGSRAAAVRGHLTLGIAYMYRGEGSRSMKHCEQGLALEQENDYFTITYGVGHDEGTLGRNMLSWAQWWIGEPDAALKTARLGYKLAQRLPSSLSQAMARHTVAFAHHLRDEPEQAIAAARENIALCEELSFPFWLGTGLIVLGANRARLGDEGGLADLDRAFGILMQYGNRGGGSMGFALLAESQRMLGYPDRAVATAELGLAISQESRQPFYDPELRRIAAVARYDQEPTDWVGVLGELERSVADARRMGAASFVLSSAIDMARVRSHSATDCPRAVADLENALASMADGSSTKAQVVARSLLEQLGTALK
jgi:class 3 adenylate cyclase/tetratricopeptide (TPR) repeat protein